MNIAAHPRTATGAQGLVGAVVVTAITTITVSAMAVVSLAFRAWFPVTAALAMLLGLTVGVMIVQRLAFPTFGRAAAAILSLISVAFTIWVWLTRSENVIVNRDPASYLQTAIAFATQHGTPLDPSMGDFGRIPTLDPHLFTLTSLGFAQVDWPLDPGIQPQFLPGATSLYTLGYWLGHMSGALWVAAIFGGLSVLAVGVTAATWFGGRYGVMASIASALSFPLVYTSRTTFSEPIALFLTVCGVMALGESVRRSRDLFQAKYWGVLAATLLVGNMLVRIDALREVLILYLVVCVLWRIGHSAARTMLRVIDIGLLICMVVWFVESWIYLLINESSVLPLLFAVIGLRLVVAVLMTDRLAHVSLGTAVLQRLPMLAAVITGIAWAVIASRPLWMVARSASTDAQILALQQQQGLAVDGTRTYVEQSLLWVSWWVGWLAVAVCAIASVMIVHRVVAHLVRGRPLSPWAVPFIIGLTSTWVILWRPGIFPDHPWADRRLVPVVVFTVLVCVGSIAWAVDRLVKRTSRAARELLVVGLGAGLVIPVGAATWPNLTERYRVGEMAGVQQVCGELHAFDGVVLVGNPAAQVWPQVIRGVCGTPAISVVSDWSTSGDAVALVTRIQAAAKRSGLSVALVAAKEQDLQMAVGSDAPIKHIDFGPISSAPSTLMTPPVGVGQSAFTELWWARLG